MSHQLAMLRVVWDPFWIKSGPQEPEEPQYLSYYVPFRITVHKSHFNRVNVEKCVFTFDLGVQKQVIWSLLCCQTMIHLWARTQLITTLWPQGKLFPSVWHSSPLTWQLSNLLHFLNNLATKKLKGRNDNLIRAIWLNKQANHRDFPHFPPKIYFPLCFYFYHLILFNKWPQISKWPTNK